MLDSKRRLIVVIEQQKLYSEQANKVEDSNKCNGFRPLLTGHLIRRMPSGCISSFNAIQRYTQ